jgi:hypothetical protein
VVNTSPGIIPGLEPYIEAGRAAAYLSISRKTVLKKARSGYLPANPNRQYLLPKCYQKSIIGRSGCAVGGQPD